MTYQETIDYLYSATPQFQQIGAAAYKPGLQTAIKLDEAFGSPHRRYATVHVAGTNGKGSTCHTLASILQHQGYRVGLYTSPHLVDFRERIRVNGGMIPQEAVVDFVERYRSMSVPVEPSFFELTTIMAFDWFARSGIDIAVIETGLGGRLDTTNIISPIATAITNISFDHTAQLGNTLASIAREKAGIIKPGVEVVVGNASNPDVREVFLTTARERQAPLTFAAESRTFKAAEQREGKWYYVDTPFGDLVGELGGDCQSENAATVICLVEALRRRGMEISDSAVREGFANVTHATGLMGRWMKLAEQPDVVCDTGHNVGGWEFLSQRLKKHSGKLHMVIGFVSDKDVSHILPMMPSDACYYFTRASIPRAMAPEAVATAAAGAGLCGATFPDVQSAFIAAMKAAAPDDMIFVGGSTFVVADLLSACGDNFNLH